MLELSNHYMVFSGLLFSLGLIGIVVNRRNVIVVLMCIELMLLAVNTNFIYFSKVKDSVAGDAFVFFILTVAAAEAAIGLAIVMLLFRQKSSISTESFNQIKG